jgi:2'-5' RNA ligase superfamily
MNIQGTWVRWLAGSMTLAALAVSSPAMAAEAEASVVAINILAVPSQPARDYARELNERLDHTHPKSFVFDETHVPHISILHRFVAARDLPQIYATVERLVSDHPLRGTELTATGLEYSRWEDAGIVSIKLETTPELTQLQTDLIRALQPYATPSGGRDAFVTSPDAPNIDAKTIEYVKTFEQEQVGDRFKPHITVGLSDSATPKNLQARSMSPMKFTIESLAICQLGNVGTARKLLWSSSTRPD